MPLLILAFSATFEDLRREVPCSHLLLWMASQDCGTSVDLEHKKAKKSGSIEIQGLLEDNVGKYFLGLRTESDFLKDAQKAQL